MLCLYVVSTELLKVWNKKSTFRCSIYSLSRESINFICRFSRRARRGFAKSSLRKQMLATLRDLRLVVATRVLDPRSRFACEIGVTEMQLLALCCPWSSSIHNSLLETTCRTFERRFKGDHSRNRACTAYDVDGRTLLLGRCHFVRFA